MRIRLTIPKPLVIYAEWHQVTPEEYAQFILEEKGREINYWLVEESRRRDRLSTDADILVGAVLN